MPPALYEGRLPSEYDATLDSIANIVLERLPAGVLGKKSFHFWLKDMAKRQSDRALLSMVDSVRKGGQFERILCRPTNPANKCVVFPVTDMDEIYYSNPPLDTSKNMYGETGLFGEHVDGAFPFLPGIRFYRFIVAVTPNRSAYTVFPRERKVSALDKGAFLGFDFNKHVHFVAGTAETPRILLKLHFCACDICKGDTESAYMKRVAQVHTSFEDATRRYMNYSTAPETPMQYAAGYCAQAMTWLRVRALDMAFILLAIFISFMVGWRRGHESSQVKSIRGHGI